MCDETEYDDAARAYETLIGAMDRAKLTVEEIRQVAELIAAAGIDIDFTLSIETQGSPQVKRTVEIKY